jgi:ribonuclease BN (tRNA processing enzyme)
MSFELLTSGVGNAFSTRHWGTHFLVRRDDFVLGIDCPDSYRRALAEHDFEHAGHRLDVDDLDALLITHLHGDHVNGLEMTLAYCHYATGNTLDLYTTRDVADVLWDRRLEVSLGQTWDGEAYRNLGPGDYYELHELTWGADHEIGPFEVTTRRTTHHIPTTALRIDDGDATLGYSCDTAFDPDLIEWLADGSELVLHETSPGPGHTSLHELADLPEPLRQKMRIVHLPDDSWELEDDVDLTFAREGRIYDVG